MCATDKPTGERKLTHVEQEENNSGKKLENQASCLPACPQSLTGVATPGWVTC